MTGMGGFVAGFQQARQQAQVSRPRLQVWVAALATWARVRTTRRMLAEMDDRMLADIGVTRSDAHMEAARPLWDTAPARR